MVSAGLFRRWNAAGLGPERRMQDRLDRPDLGRDLPGLPTPRTSRQAMKAVDEHLVRHEDRLILLFTPPFDHSSLDPGYVKGYLPGVRENGGQYTHAAVWVMQAAALLGQGRLASRTPAAFSTRFFMQITRKRVERYRVEPYVLAGDVYSAQSPRGTRRLDMVHRIGELVLPDQSRVDPRFSPCGRPPHL